MSLVLIIDEMSVSGEAIAKVLPKYGFRATVTSPDSDIFAALTKHNPDLLILDVASEKYNGLGLLQTLRADKRWHKLPVVVLSDTSDKEYVIGAHQAGVHAYLVREAASVTELLTSVDEAIKAAWWGPVKKGKNKAQTTGSDIWKTSTEEDEPLEEGVKTVWRTDQETIETGVKTTYSTEEPITTGIAVTYGEGELEENVIPTTITEGEVTESGIRTTVTQGEVTETGIRTTITQGEIPESSPQRMAEKEKTSDTSAQEIAAYTGASKLITTGTVERLYNIPLTWVGEQRMLSSDERNNRALLEEGTDEESKDALHRVGSVFGQETQSQLVALREQRVFSPLSKTEQYLCLLALEGKAGEKEFFQVLQSDWDLFPAWRASLSLVLGTQNVVSLEEAMRALSTTRLITLAAAAMLHRIMLTPQYGTRFFRHWGHAAAVSIIMEQISLPAKNVYPTTTSLMGLFHEIAALTLEEEFNKQYGPSTEKKNFLGTLSPVFGVLYNDSIGEVLRGLGIPEALIPLIQRFDEHKTWDSKDTADRYSQLLRAAKHYANSMLFSPTPNATVRPIPKLVYQDILTSFTLPKIDEPYIRTSIDAIADCLEETQNPVEDQDSPILFAECDARLLYLRYSSFVEPDPLGIALGQFARVDVVSRIPKNTDLLREYSALVVAAPRLDSPEYSIETILSLTKQLSGREFPILYLIDQAEKKTTVFPEDQPTLTIETYPVSLSTLFDFINSIEDKELLPEDET